MCRGGFHGRKSGDVFEQFIGCSVFRAEFSFFLNSDIFCVFEIIPEIAYDMPVGDESMCGVMDGAPVAVVAEYNIGGA